MLLKKINLVDQLQKERKRIPNPENLMDEFYKVLEENDRIIKNTKKSSTSYNYNFNLDLLETTNIFHVNQIKKICIDYRLRFLDTKYFKGKIPQEAINKIAKLEALHAIEIKNFKIIAPSKLFKLEDKDDPLLFATLGNDYYYLIHKWGNDLHPLRKSLMLPFKNIINLLILIGVISYLCTLLVPKGLFSGSNSNGEFIILGFFIFKTIAAITLYYGIAMRKNFNPKIWNSKYM